MQTVKPRAVFVPSTNEWIIKGSGIVKVRPCLDSAIAAWNRRFIRRQLGLPNFS